MGFRQILSAFGAKLDGLLRARRIRTMIFSGTPVLSGIVASENEPGTWSLTFKNGLMLTLGEAGILDYQDRDFGHFIGHGRSGAQDNRDFLVQLHKLVLKSLLRYIIHPGLNARQREHAAEAATKLWLATEDHPGMKPDFSSVDGGSWSPGSPHESARFH